MRQLLSCPKSLVFVLLSLSDLALTWWLLEYSGRVVCEANPVADWWLSRYGWLGLAGFKATMVLLVIVLAAIIARRRPHAAGRILGFACAALVLVVLHSVALGRTAKTADEFVEEINQDLEESNRAAHRRTSKIFAYFALLANVTDDVAAGKSTLPQAVERLAQAARSEDGDFLQNLARTHPGCSLRECLAIEITTCVHKLRCGAGLVHAGRFPTLPAQRVGPSS